MANKDRFTKEMLLNCGYEYVSMYGVDNITVRELAKFIGCSTQPIFKNFKNMDDFKKKLKIHLHNDYNSFIYKYIKEEDYLYTISYAYALYAKKNPKVFKTLFMSSLAGTRTIEEVLNSKWNLDTIKSIPSQYNVTEEEANQMYRDVRFFTHGLACQIACNSIRVTENEIKELIRNIISKVRGGYSERDNKESKESL